MGGADAATSRGEEINPRSAFPPTCSREAPFFFSGADFVFSFGFSLYVAHCAPCITVARSSVCHG